MSPTLSALTTAPAYSPGTIRDDQAPMVLTKAGSGTETLTGVDTYSGGTNVAAGTLNINADTAPGSPLATATFTGNSVLQAGAANIALSGGLSLDVDQFGRRCHDRHPGLRDGHQWRGQRERLCDEVGTGTLTLPAPTPTAARRRSPAARCELPAAGSIANSAVINLNGGSLDVSTVTTPPFVLGGSQTLKGAGAVTGAVTVNGTVAPGQTNNVPTMTASTLTLGSGSSLSGSALLDLIAGTGGADQIAFANGAANSATLGGTLTVTNPNAITSPPGRTTTCSTSTPTPRAEPSPAVNLPSLGTSTLAWNTANLYSTGVISVVTAGPPLGSGTWTNRAGGQTWTNANNWMTGQPSGATYVATFDATGYTATNPNPVLLGMAGQTVGGLVFNTSAATGYTIGGGGSDGSLTLNNNGNSAATITVNGGDQIIAANVVVAETTGATLERRERRQPFDHWHGQQRRLRDDGVRRRQHDPLRRVERKRQPDHERHRHVDLGPHQQRLQRPHDGQQRHAANRRQRR